MLFRLAAVITVAFIIVCSPHQESQGADCYAEYIAGVSLIQDPSLGMTLKEKIKRYKQLQSITGVSAEEATAYIGSLKNDPEKGKGFAVALQRAITEQNDSLQNKPRSVHGK